MGVAALTLANNALAKNSTNFETAEPLFTKSKSYRSSIIKSSTFDTIGFLLMPPYAIAGTRTNTSGLAAQTISIFPTNGKANKDDTINDQKTSSLLNSPFDSKGRTKVLITLDFPTYSTFNGLHLYSFGIFP